MKSSFGGRAGKRGGSSLIALGSVAVLTVYAAGYARTKPAADRMASASSDRRSAAPRIEASAAAAAASTASMDGVSGSAVDTAHPLTGESRATSTHGIDASIEPALVTASHANNRELLPDSLGSHSLKTTTKTTQTANADTMPALASVPVVAEPNPSIVTPSASVTAPVATPTPPTAPTSAPPPMSPDASASPATPAKTVWRDGLFVGRGTSRHGDIEAMVEIKDGRIIGAVISQCLTRYSCSWINHLLPQVVERQSADVDYVSGATQSANALYYAVTQALAQAK